MRVSAKGGQTSQAVACAGHRIRQFRFMGMSIVKLDQKARFCLPARFRSVLETDTMIMVLERFGKGALFPLEVWDEWEAELDGPAKTHLSSCSRNVKLDGAGRILIPAKALELSGLIKGEEFVLVGKGDHIEFWSNKTWQEEKKSFPKTLL
jgi:MraZ protein